MPALTFYTELGGSVDPSRDSRERAAVQGSCLMLGSLLGSIAMVPSIPSTSRCSWSSEAILFRAVDRASN